MNPIEHIIVLMFENRSFDHMLGFLPGAGGLTGSEYNLVDPTDPHSEPVRVSNTADYLSRTDPPHDLPSVNVQLSGSKDTVVDPPLMNGFVKACADAAGGNVAVGKTIMQCFDPARLPALTTLAQEFCLCDHWFSSVPGPTWPNRFFVHAATSDGKATNDVLHRYDMQTIYDNVAASGRSWTIYYSDFPQSIALQQVWRNRNRLRPFRLFQDDVRSGRLANYCFIEPRYFDLLSWKATDQHPPHDIKLGEYLIAEIYSALRNSNYWEKSLFIVLYDEHGGFYDHVPPPTGVPNPDGQVSMSPPFDFTRLGMRVAAVLVSPFVEKGRVDSTRYEHASVPATAKAVFGLPAFLTARDAAAHTCESSLTLSVPRTDAPVRLPVPGTGEEIRRQRALLRSPGPSQSALVQAEREEMSLEPLTEFQITLLQLAERLSEESGLESAPVERIQTEHEAAVYLRRSLASLLGK